jgi:hypothetical protein
MLRHSQSDLEEKETMIDRDRSKVETPDLDRLGEWRDPSGIHACPRLGKRRGGIEPFLSMHPQTTGTDFRGGD